jgi:dCMP deaminase
LESIYRTPDLRPYFRVAEEHQEHSPCIRRKYAALIGYSDIKDNPLWVVETNSRQSRCCNGTCVRSDRGFLNGERVEMGAEIHAETAALIAARNKGDVFILTGRSQSGPLYGPNVYPCHGCALAIRFAGYKHIHIKTDKDTIQAVSIAEIIEYREQEWEANE